MRALGTGAMGTLLDHGVGLGLAWLGAPTRVAAGSGKLAGALFGYLGHRVFSFTDHAQPLARSGARYALVTVVVTLLHGQLVVWLRDGLGLPYLAAAVLGDAVVGTPVWMLALRFFVFPAAARSPPGNREAPAIVSKPPGT